MGAPFPSGVCVKGGAIFLGCRDSGQDEFRFNPRRGVAIFGKGRKSGGEKGTLSQTEEKILGFHFAEVVPISIYCASE
jgi:hypothetical protein